MRIGWKGIFLVLAIVLVVAYVGVMSVLPEQHDALQSKCQSIECILEDSGVHRYITDKQIIHYLHSVGLYPVGKTLDQVSLQAIEDTLVAHPILASADCYLTNDGQMRIHLTQRTPIVHVMTNDENYFVGTDRKPIPAWSTITDTVLEVRGQLNHKQTCGEVADFAEWLQNDTIWREQVDYLWHPAPHQYTLLLIGDTTQILLGDLTEYPKQLHRLHQFREHGGEILKKQAYRQLDLRFNDQVVGRH